MRNTRQQPRPARALGRFLAAGASAAGLYSTILPVARAANRNWDGSDSQAWETASNWAENAAPTSADIVFIGTTGSLPNHPVVSTGAQAAAELWFGAFSGNPSRLDVTGGSLALSTRLVIAPDDASVVTVNQSGGAVSLTSGTNALILGRNGGDATYNMSGGTLASNTWFNIGDSGAGGTSTFNLTNGMVNAATGAGAVNIGDQGGATGALNVSGGVFNSANTTANGGIVVGNHWTGTGTNTATLTVSGTGLVNTGSSTAGNGLKLASGAASVGTVNLDGGVIATAKVQKGAGAGTFNFNGGTLRATASNAAFMSGLTNAFVKAGGAIVDTNGFDVTIGQALLADAVSAGGGLTKDGAGTLTLTGANTFTGDIAINAGTLSINSAFIADGADVSLLGGATFNLNFAGMDSISFLFINGEAQALGTYGAIGSGADFELAALTGSGWLNVTAAIPEPSGCAILAGLAGVGVAGARRRRR